MSSPDKHPQSVSQMKFSSKSVTGTENVPPQDVPGGSAFPPPCAQPLAHVGSPNVQQPSTASHHARRFSQSDGRPPLASHDSLADIVGSPITKAMAGFALAAGQPISTTPTDGTGSHGQLPGVHSTLRSTPLMSSLHRAEVARYSTQHIKLLLQAVEDVKKAYQEHMQSVGATFDIVESASSFTPSPFAPGEAGVEPAESSRNFNRSFDLPLTSMGSKTPSAPLLSADDFAKLLYQLPHEVLVSLYVKHYAATQKLVNGRSPPVSHPPTSARSAMSSRPDGPLATEWDMSDINPHVRDTPSTTDTSQSLKSDTRRSEIVTKSISEQQLKCYYKKLGVLGKGCCGEVFLVCDVNTGVKYAMKKMDKNLIIKRPRAQLPRGGPSVDDLEGSGRGSAVQPPALGPTAMVDREIATMKCLCHKNIVRLHRVIEDDEEEEVYLVMDYIDNGCLAKADERTGTYPIMPVEEAFAKMYQVATGLEYMHRHGIIHRDLKPENILVDSKGNTYVADFGLGSILTEAKHFGMVEGTLAFRSPELCKCGTPTEIMKCGEQSDVFALGGSLYAVIFGIIPFPGSTMPSMVQKIMEGEPQFPAETDPRVVEIIQHLLHKDPNQRMTLNQFRHHPFVRECAGKPLRGEIARPEHYEQGPRTTVLAGIDSAIHPSATAQGAEKAVVSVIDAIPKLSRRNSQILKGFVQKHRERIEKAKQVDGGSLPRLPTRRSSLDGPLKPMSRKNTMVGGASFDQSDVNAPPPVARITDSKSPEEEEVYSPTTLLSSSSSSSIEIDEQGSE